MQASSTTESQLRWAPWWVLASVALWPLPGPAEAVLSLGALAALAVLAIQRFRGGMALLSHEAWALTTVLFLSYWLPELLSSPDAINARRAVRESLLDLCSLPFLWLVAIAVANDRGRRLTFAGIAVICGFWLLDALVQAATGWSLGGQATADRLSGVFGAGNLKLGLVLASLAPFPLIAAADRFGLRGWLVVAMALVVATAFSDKLQERVQRTGAMLDGSSEGVDHALSGRLPIWRTAANMAIAHPVNGVGVRGFRDAYPEYADETDPWLDDPDHGAGYHAHQIVLEVLSETGLVGAFFWIGGAALAWRAWRFASPEARRRARAPALALAVTVFPLNTHLAFYSTFWGGLTLLLAALYAGSLLADKPRGDAADEA